MGARARPRLSIPYPTIVSVTRQSVKHLMHHLALHLEYEIFVAMALVSEVRIPSVQDTLVDNGCLAMIST